MKKSDTIIKNLRSELQLSQVEFADKIGVTQSYISQIENGKVDVSLSLFITWCDVIKIKNISINIINYNISYN